MATWSTKKAFGAGIQKMAGICTDGTDKIWFFAQGTDTIYEYLASTNTETEILDGSVDITNFNALYNIAVFGGELYAPIKISNGGVLSIELYKYTGTPNSWTKVDFIDETYNKGVNSETGGKSTLIWATSSVLLYMSEFSLGSPVVRYVITRYSTDGSTFNTVGTEPYDAMLWIRSGFLGSGVFRDGSIYTSGNETSTGNDVIWKYNESTHAWTEIINGGNAQYEHRFTAVDNTTRFADWEVDFVYTDDDWTTMTNFGSVQKPIISYGTAAQYSLDGNNGDLYTYSGGTFTLVEAVATFVASVQNTAIIRLSDGTSLICGRDLLGSGNGIILERSEALPAPPTPSLTHSAAGLPGAILI